MTVTALDEALDTAAFGGKAAQLAAAVRAGLPVPAGVALPAEFVDAVSAREPGATRQLEDAFVGLRSPLAARSSAVGEDSEEASFAGQHLTRLNVRSPEALAEAVREIWESARSASALAYRERVGAAGEPRIGVVIQELVDPDSAGVLFTRNPVDGADELVIEASWGLGEAVVAGLVVPDRYRVARDGTVLERTAGWKDIAVRVGALGGTVEGDVPPEQVAALCLDDRQLSELHALALRCERVFSGSQDLEWAFVARDLYLLQRRPLTRVVVPEA